MIYKKGGQICIQVNKYLPLFLGERYRALGIADGVKPNDNGTTWNNTRAATLEDYKLKDADELIYTSEAIVAENRQLCGE